VLIVKHSFSQIQMGSTGGWCEKQERECGEEAAHYKLRVGI